MTGHIYIQGEGYLDTVTINRRAGMIQTAWGLCRVLSWVRFRDDEHILIEPPKRDGIVA